MTDEQTSDHYCMTCRYALDRMTIDGKVSYVHTAAGLEAWTGPEHEPAPAPMIEFTTKNMLCDVCNNPQPVWSYTFARVVIEYTVEDGDSSLTENVGERWAICKQCGEIIERKDVAALVDRARIPLRANGFDSDEAVHAVVLPVYKKILGRPFERMPLREVR